MSVSGVNSSPIRFTGMASGLDTESIVSQMIASEQTRIDKVEKQSMTLTWEQEAYRGIIDKLNSFESKYFNVLSEDYILSSNAFSAFNINYSENNVANISATAGAVAGDYKVEVVQLAESAQIEGKPLNTSEDVTLSNWQNGTIEFDLEGIETAITLDSGVFADLDALVTDINAKINASDLKGKIQAVNDGTAVKFNVMTVETVKITSDTTISDLDNLENKVINPNNYTKLSDLGTESELITLKFTISGDDKFVTIDNSDGSKTINDLRDAVSDATEGRVSARLSELTGEVTFETNSTGSSTTLKIEETSSTSLLSSIGITGLGVSVTNEATGQDSQAKITPPGSNVSTTIVRTTNKFTIDNINYELLVEGKTTDITVTQNVDETFDKLKGFIDAYNELIGEISSKLDEKKDYDYAPLTDAEKEAMSDEEIEKWEEKAKEGILRNDSSLDKMLRSLRGAFFESVDGAGISFSNNQLGLDTSGEVADGGKIIIKDAEKFKEVLANNSEQVMKLFTNNADINYSRALSSSDRAERYGDSGIFRRMSDIIKDNISTSRDSDGNKGVLLEKAGLKDDTSFINNILTKQIEERENLIIELTERMYEKEESLYLQFAQLETSMNSLNSQSEWLASQLGGV